MNFSQIQAAVQKQTMSPQIYQQMELMALSVLDLQARINEELENNPALQIRKTKKSSSEIIEKTAWRQETLQAHLLFQLHIQPVNDEIIKAGEYLIQNLDKNGFNIENPQNINSKITKKNITEAQKLIQALDPQGTCTDNYLDSLIVQAKLRPDMPKHTVEILLHHLSALEKKWYKEIAEKLKISLAEVMKTLDFIRTLQPFPGMTYSSEEPQYIIPILKITIENEEIAIYLLENDIPPLKISSSFVSQGENHPEAKKFIAEKVQEAKDFINMIEIRNNTILKTANSIIKFQDKFFRNGPKFLVPLAMKDVAADIDVSESTVSRVTSKNFVQTDWGIFPMSYFFSTKVKTEQNNEISENLSKESVKSIICDIIKENRGEKKLSDQKISQILEEKGLKVARRTVAKYRQELDIASSYER